MSRRVLLGAFVALSAALPSAPAIAQVARPSITEVSVDIGLDMIVVLGSGFGNTRTITLGDDATVGDITADCVINAASQPNTIVCTLSGGLPPPGDYRLTVARNPALRDSYDLTIGAVGPAGPTGPQGPDGPAGPPGAAGVSGYEVVDDLIGINIPANGTGTAGLNCPAGKVVLGGFCSITWAGWVMKSTSIGIPSATSFSCTFQDIFNNAASANVDVRITCADVTN